MASDRIFGLVMAIVALAYIASATQIQTSFLSDPVGPKTFPILIGTVCAISAIFMVLKPDAEPEWPVLRTFGALCFAVFVLVFYAYALKPLGFIIRNKSYKFLEKRIFLVIHISSYFIGIRETLTRRRTD